MTAPTTRSCRPLGDWIAVQPLPAPQGTILEPKKRGIKYKRGKILRLGHEAPGLSPGTVVWYEAHSAHPCQDRPIPAEWFGGEEGAWAFLIRAPRRAAPSVERDDAAHDRISAEVERMRAYWRARDMPEKKIPETQKLKMKKLRASLSEIDALRETKRRSRRLGHASDIAVREGIFAVEEDRNPHMDWFYRTP